MTTTKQIAEALGLSRPTVSFVLNGRCPKGVRIPDSTRQRILAAAREMGYQPNALARAMVTGRTRVIGFLGMMGAEYTTRMLRGVLECAQRHDYLVKVLMTSGDSEDKALHRAVQQRLAGVVSIHADEAFLAQADIELRRQAIPLAVVDHTTLNLGKRRLACIRVVSDDEAGVRNAVRHLTELGHSRIAYLSVADAHMNTGWAARESGFRKAVRRHGLSGRVIVAPDTKKTDAHARPLLADLLRSRMRPTAIVCASDYLAAWALRIACEAGLRVPGDISVVGFADQELARYVYPALTTVAQPFELMGMKVAECLLDAVERRIEDARNVKPMLLPTRLVVRESTGPVGREREA
ncbi:MAG: LacI family DNA-binding transcriptional regulator [Kiritimatiellae bacterium]|nr:LacI family DNA-binding transcriptional regulator [Kiritimatiellia bacterium]